MLRRAIYFGHQNLKAKQRFLTILVSAFIESMSGDFPELLHNEKKIKDIIAEEEITFATDKKKFKKKDSKRRKKEKNNTEQNVVVTRPPKVSYKTRTIDFFGRPTHIIHQHENGPCGNVLLLRSEIGLFLNKTEVMEDDLLSRIISRLKRCRKMQFELHEGFQYLEFQHKVLSAAKNLWREVCINVTFKSTDGFVFSPEYAHFDYLEIPVFHGWLVDQDSELASAIATSSYDELNLEVGEYISQKEAMGIKGRVEQISDFLQGPQLTAYGLSCLHKDLEEKKPCVLFWNNHWSTVIKVNGGGSFVDSSFTPIKYAGEGASFCSDQARQIQKCLMPVFAMSHKVTKNLLIPNGGPRDLVERMNGIILEEMLLLERKIRHEDLSAVEVVTEEQLPPAEITDVHSSSSTPEVARSDQLKDAAASQTPKCSIQAVPYSTPISSPQPLGRQIIAEEERAQLLFGSFGCCDLKYWPSYPTVVCNSDVMAKSVPTVSNKRGFSSFVDKPLYISKASSEHRAQQSAFTNRFLEFLRGFRLGNTEEPYYKGTAASMVFLDLPMMDLKFDHIKIFDNELALMICHDFERSRLDLNYAAKSFIMDFRSQLEGMFMKKFESFDNIIVRIDGLPKIDRLMSLEAFVKLPGNHFVEPRTLFATGSSLTVASGTRVGRIIATGALQEILKAHASRNSWNGSFKRKNILVRNGCYSEISMPFHAEFSRDSMLNDYIAYFDEVISLFELKGVGCPAFFPWMRKSLLRFMPAPSPSFCDEFRHFQCFAMAQFALKRPVVRIGFLSNLYRLRRCANRQVRKTLLAILRSLSLRSDWRVIVLLHSHPILVKVYLFNKKMDKEGNGGGKTKEGNGENSKDQKGGEKTNDADYKMAKLTKYDNSANHLVIYTRHVIEHGMDPAQLESDDEVLEDEMYQLDDESIEMLSELDLLYSHYLELNDMLEELFYSGMMTKELWQVFEEILDVHNMVEPLYKDDAYKGGRNKAVVRCC
uniref:MINDY deubiquitinase domain-containing protein n=1 Tax=Oryza rufipogon TaxID=4529 RepID=A0A0E0Q6B9_ORYRU